MASLIIQVVMPSRCMGIGMNRSLVILEGKQVMNRGVREPVLAAMGVKPSMCSLSEPAQSTCMIWIGL